MAEAPYWLVLPRAICGFEGDGDGGSSGDGDAGSDGNSDDDDDTNDDAGKDKAKTSGDDGRDKALRAEREARRKAEKELKDLRKFKADKDAEGKSDAENAGARADKAEKQAAAAMEALRRTAAKAAVMTVVRAHPFRDPDKVAKAIAADLGDDFFELDDESMELTFDEDKLKKLAEDEAKSGSYTMADDDTRDDGDKGESKPPRSGSAHSGRRDGKTNKADDDAIRAKYGLGPATSRSA